MGILGNFLSCLKGVKDPFRAQEGKWDFSRVETGMSGNFLSCSKGAKDPFEVQEGRCDFARHAVAEKGLISPGGENLLFFSSFSSELAVLNE